jgi:hypothetical protein
MSQLFTSQNELEQFVAYFSVKRNHKDLRNRIKLLPEHLRYSKRAFILHKSGYKENERYNYMDRPSCSVHKWIDSIAVSVIFESLRKELTTAIRHLNVGNYIDHAFGPDEYMTLHRVAAIQEMWTKPGPDSITSERWKYQADQCEACMLSRIATYPSALRELRTVFLAHPTMKLYWPIILTFVDEWIKLTDQWKSLFKMSEERAKEIKKCIKHWKIHNGEETDEDEDEAKKQQPQNAKGLETLPALSHNPTLPFTQDMPSPLFSSTITRPLSRNEYELSESEFLREFSPNNKTFYRISSTEDDDSSSDITDIYSQDNDTRTSLGLSKTIAVLQKQQIIDQYRDGRGGGESSDRGLSSRLYSPWSSTVEIRGSYSRFSQSTVSSPSYSAHYRDSSPPISPINDPNTKTPDRYKTPVSPLANSKTPQERYIPTPKTPKTPDRNRTLLPIPEVSPFQMSPFVSSSSQNPRPSSSRAHTSAVAREYSSISAFSPGKEVMGTELIMRKEQPRVVHVSAARDGKRYTQVNR